MISNVRSCIIDRIAAKDPRAFGVIVSFELTHGICSVLMAVAGVFALADTRQCAHEPTCFRASALDVHCCQLLLTGHARFHIVACVPAVNASIAFVEIIQRSC
eukprot:693996_1